jgi:hypothetical protein
MSPSRDWRPRSEASCSLTRVASVVVVESLMSRSRCSTPISSASSASIADGTWRKVFLVSVPSCVQKEKSGVKVTLRNSNSHP